MPFGSARKIKNYLAVVSPLGVLYEDGSEIIWADFITYM